jgi:long-chain acyl-CoA synthetase
MMSKSNDKPSRLFDLLGYYANQFPGQKMLSGKFNGQWAQYSGQEVLDISEQVAKSLIVAGIEIQDRIGIIAQNEPKWNLADMGIQMAGAIVVPVYVTLHEDELLQIFNHAGVSAIFIGDKELEKKILKIRDRFTTPPLLISFRTDSECISWDLFLDSGKGLPSDVIQSRQESVQSEDIATIIYTSGTTGEPKGVMLTHQNMISNFTTNAPEMPVQPGDKALSFLPLCHVYERMCTYMYMYAGLSIWYAEGLEKISDNLKEVQPHIFTTVPRLLEKVYDKIVLKGRGLKGISRMLFQWSLRLGHQYEVGSERSIIYGLQLQLARSLIFSKWKAGLGGNVKAIVSGGAALQPRLARIFWAAGIPVAEGYGLTETSPVIAVNTFTPDRIKFASVGKVISGCTVKILPENENDPEGEILVKGPNVMKGYYRAPDLTAEVIDIDGWFHTGDIGRMDSEGFLKITDRKKEIFKTSGGKYIAPQPIENKLKESLYIQQAMVIGEYRDHPAALIVIDKENIRRYLKELNVSYHEETLHNHPEVRKCILGEIKNTYPALSILERIHKFVIVPDEWSQETRELTPTLKLRRKFIILKYHTEIEALYS